MRLKAEPFLLYVLAYLAGGAIWIWGSEYLLAAIVPRPTLYLRLSDYQEWVLLLVSAGLLYVLLKRDEGRRRAIQDALTEEQHRWQAAFEQSTIGIAQVLPGGRFLAVNQALCEMLGYSEDELHTMTLGNLLPASGRRKRAITDQILHTGARSLSLEQQLMTRSEEFIWARVTASLITTPDGRPDHFVVFLEDITPRKLPGQPLSRSPQLMEKILASLDEAIFLIDPRGRIILYCNQAVRTLFGYEPEELIGKSTAVLHVSPEHFQRFAELSESRLKQGKPFYGEFRMRRRDGSLIATDHYVTGIENVGDWNAGVISVVRRAKPATAKGQAIAHAEGQG